ncbi:uncharacterized protein LOC128737638 [Sabethes cyaneus]|uniref:uncharacterized protein LOC128737638 n=1 Tax=Sabethes cyaneus TaxID=53552 RepID=UPI00237EA000|nr:uncharacterized protein LOC128737638 [Sabethes cyaneus]
MISTTNDLLRNIAGLCRVCSAPGSHSLFAKIPPYLHEHPRECPRWSMPICKLVTEVAGIEINEDDELPQKICVVCISYLKHAYTFRRQTIDNVAAVLAARYLIGLETQCEKGIIRSGSSSGKDAELISTFLVPAAVVRTEVSDVANRMMNVAPNGSISFQKNLDKEVMQHILGGNVKAKKKQNNVEEEQRYVNGAENYRNEVSPMETGGYFTYTEKEFEEDDVMELDVLKEHNIAFNLPVDYKEKKCPSCRKRFMFDDSLSEHLEKCLQFKLIKFIREVYHLLCLKESRAISSFEFIRRVVFAIRRSVDQIATLDGEVEDREDEEENVQPLAQVAETPPVEVRKSYLKNLEKLRTSYNQEGNKIPSPALTQPIEDGRSSITTGSTSISPAVTATRCEECHVQFETVTELEAHSLNYHRELPPGSTLNNQHPILPFPKQVLQLAEKDVSLIKNQLISNTPEPTVEGGGSPSEDSFKTVQCSTCKKRFYMISQLDEHRIRYHTQKPSRKKQSHSNQGSPLDNTPKNLNDTYFHTMEQLKNIK